MSRQCIANGSLGKRLVETTARSGQWHDKLPCPQGVVLGFEVLILNFFRLGGKSTLHPGCKRCVELYNGVICTGEGTLRCQGSITFCDGLMQQKHPRCQVGLKATWRYGATAEGGRKACEPLGAEATSWTLLGAPGNAAKSKHATRGSWQRC